MARVDTLGHFLTDVADAIRTKKGSSDTIQASSFDTEITNLPSGGGADLNEYFYAEITQNTDSTNNMKDKTVKKLADVIVADTVTSLAYAYSGSNGTNTLGLLPKVICNNNVTALNHMYFNINNVANIDLSGINASNVTTMANMFRLNSPNTALKTINFGSNFNTNKVENMSYLFYGCRGLNSLDMSSCETSSLTSVRNMFYDCRGLSFLDIRKMTFTNVNDSGSMLQNVPTTCEIIVKSQTEKTWFNTNFSSYTNVKTVAEYESE